MTTDLWMLVAAAALAWTLMIAAATPTLLKHTRWALGNRDDPRPTEAPVWQKRLQRLSGNMQENLPLFAVLVLVAHVSGSANDTSALGAQLFVGARVVHAIVYGVGVPYLRTVIWSISVVGMGLVAFALI